MTIVDREKLEKAKASSTGELAKSWDIEKIKKYTESELIYCIRMLEDRSLFVFFNPVPAGQKYKNPPVEDHFIVETSANSYKLFLDVSGLLNVGESKSFLKPQPDELGWKIEHLHEYFENNRIFSVEFLPTGSIEFILRGYGMNSLSNYTFDAKSDKGKLVLARAGISSPGKKVVFPKAQEQFDKFLRTGEEPEWKSIKS